jgi:hypothetical protein
MKTTGTVLAMLFLASASLAQDRVCTTKPDPVTGGSETVCKDVKPAPDSILQTLQKQQAARRDARQATQQAVATQPPQTDEQAVTNIRWCQQNPHTDVALQGIGVRSCGSVLEWFARTCAPTSNLKLCKDVTAANQPQQAHNLTSSGNLNKPFILATGNDLSQLLDTNHGDQSRESAEFSFAVGYIRAVSDLLCSENQIRCAKTTDNQLRAIVAKFLANNPEVLDRPVLPLVIRSLSEALPPDNPRR